MQITKNKTTSTKIRFFGPLSKLLLGTAGALVLGGFLLLQTWAAPGDGPIVQYSFEDANNLGKDSSSAGNNATNNGVTQTLGRVGKAGYFDGSSKLRVEYNPSLKWETMTASFWMKPSFQAGEGLRSVIGKQMDNPPSINPWIYTDYTFNVHLDGNGNTDHLYMRSGRLGGTHIGLSPTINKNQWYHITTTSDNSNVKIYLNGNLVHSFVREYTGSTDRYPLQIGMADNAFVGAIDELKIYDYARTAEQIKADYEQEAKPTLIINYQNENGETIIPSTTHTQNLDGATFQLGVEYTVKPALINDPQLSNAKYDTPDTQNITFTQAERMKEVTFVYKKPRLVLHYTFDEGGTNVADSSQLDTKNPGTVQGNFTWDEWGRVGGMYRDTAIQTQRGLGIGTSAAFTIAGWIKTDDTGGQRYFITNTADADGYRFGISGGKPSFLLGTYHAGRKYTEDLCGTRNIADGNWHHLVGVFEAKGQKVSCYVDGVKDGERLLPDFYTKSWDGQARIGGNNKAMATFREKGSLDDLRVYNYALSPQQIKGLYESFPAEETKAPVELALTTTSTRTQLVVGEKVVVSTNLDLNRAGKNLSLVITVPKTLTAESNSISLLNGESVLSGTMNMVELADKRVYTYNLKDGLKGQIKSDFSVFFPHGITSDQTVGKITAEIIKGSSSSTALVQKELTFTAWAPYKLDMHWLQYTKPGNNYSVKYALNMYTTTSRPWNPTHFYFPNDGSEPSLYNFVAEIPLPAKAKYISSKPQYGQLSISYDKNKHAVIMKTNGGAGYLQWMWNNRQMIELEYSGLQAGEVITAAPITFTGYLASPTGKLYTGSVNWVNQTVEAANNNITLGFHMPQGSIVDDQDRQELFGLWISNGGNTKVKNASVEFALPEGIEVTSLRLPAATETNGNGHEVFWPHTINFDYQTNKGKSGSINGNYGAGYGKAELGLSDGEYLKKFVIKFPEINPGDTIPNMMGHANLGLRFNGDAKKIKVNGIPITSDTTLTMTGTFRAEGLPDRPVSGELRVVMKSFAPTYIQTFTHNGKNFTSGQKIRMRTFFWIQPGWHYNNGVFLKNPSVFLLVPRGFELDTASINTTVTAGTATLSAPRKVTSQVTNPPANHEVWRIDITADLYPHSPNIYIDYELKVTDSTVPGTYQFGDKAVMTTDNSKYQPWSAWAVGVKDDPYGLYGAPKGNKIVRGGNTNIIITSTDLGNGVYSKTSVDTLGCKGSFNPEELDTLYNYKSGGTGLLQTTLWNAGATINNYAYTFRIPNVNTTNTNGTKNEWKPTIKSVEIAGVTGATYTETQEAHATLLKITIPTFTANDHPVVNVVLQAPTFDDSQAYKNTYIDTYYTVNGVQKAGRTVGLRLVPSGFRPDADSKYKFCLMAKDKNQNQGISVDECKALLDLYRETKPGNGNWTRSNGWRLGDDTNKNSKWYNETVPAICSWEGIHCANNKLVGLNLSNNNLQKAFTGSFKNLKNLETLNLSNNPNFNAEFKSDFSSTLTKLKEINFTSTKTKNLNHLPASIQKITAQKLTLTEFPFANLAELKEIDLSHGTLTGVNNLNNLFNRPKLEKLIIHNAKLRGTIPNTLASTATIKEINLKNNQLTGKLPNWVKNLTSQPVKIDFSSNYITGPFPDWDANFNSDTEINFQQNYIDTLYNEGNFKKFRARFNRLNADYYQFKLVAVAGAGIRPIAEIENVQGGKKLTINVRKQAISSADAGAISTRPFNDDIKLLAEPQSSYLQAEKRGEIGFNVWLTQGFVSTLNIRTELGNEPMLSLKLIPSKDFQDENDENKPQDKNNLQTQALTGKTMFGTGLTFDLKGKYLAQYFSAVHYSLGGNDIGGGFFWREVEDLDTPVVISANRTGNIECYGRVKGFYYSSQRGERLWPLDEESKEQLKNLSSTYDTLTTEGGRYTRCQGNENNIYGKITHTYGADQKKYEMVAGVSYNVDQNKPTTPPVLRCNLQRLNNAIPFGYIYDSAGGIGILGASVKTSEMKEAFKNPASYLKIYNFHKAYLNELESGKCVSDIFDHDGKDPRYIEDSISGHSSQDLDRLLDFGFGSAQTTLFKLGIRGIIGLSTELSNNSRGSIEGNQAGTSLLLNTDNSIAGVINLARQKAEELCRNKWQPVPGGYHRLRPNTNVLCYDGSINGSSNRLHVDYYDVGENGKTIDAIIVKNADVLFDHYQWGKDLKAHTANLFIDKGDLLLIPSTPIGELTLFDENGYRTADPTNPGISHGNFLKGNFIVNGLILGVIRHTSQFVPIKNKLVIHGKVASYNTYTTPDADKRQTIKNILESDVNGGIARTVEEAKLNFIGLDQVFKWSCNSATGTGSDGTPCIGTDKGSSFITNKAFSLIDMDLPSPLFR